jgi:glycosyltransferase involved in cell wall biosynthesis
MNGVHFACLTEAPPAHEVARETVCAIIPAFAEERFIGDVVRGVLSHLDRVIVVDDGSGDGTAALAEAAGAEVIRHRSNRGKGAAIKTGLNRGLSNYSHFLLLDADGQHDPAEIPVFLNAARDTGAKLIIGNRMGNIESMPAARRWTNQFMSWQVGRLCGRSLPDSQCGFRLAHRDLVPLLLASNNGFAFETESLLLASQHGFRIEFVTVRAIYHHKQSKIRPIRDAIQYLKLLRKYRGPRCSGRKGVESRKWEVDSGLLESE